MDYEKKYNEALERAKKFEEKYGGGYAEYIFPELTESEDERIRKLLVWQVYRNIEDETNDLAQSVYDGIKGHDPDLEESIEDWKKCLAYLEKQKEQKPEWSEEDENKLYQVMETLLADKTVALRDTPLCKALHEAYDEMLAWLRSLRPQYHGDVTMTEAYKMGLEAGKASSWKPSEEQMEALNKARRFIPYNCDILESLYNQLKKL